MNTGKKIILKNASIYDPSRNLNGHPGDLYIAGTKISAPFTDPDAEIDCGGRVLLAGGIEPFAHAATPGIGNLRINRGIPSAGEIGAAYAKCGYVHIHQPLMTLLTAKAVWHSLDRIPYLDKSAWVSIDMRDMGKYIKGNNPDEFTILSRALLKMTGAIGLMLPFPYLKHRQRHYMHMNISQKKTLEFISEIKDRSILPVNLWGQPGLLEAELPVPENFNIADAGEACVSDEALNNLEKFLAAGGAASIRLNSGRDAAAVNPLLSPAPDGYSYDLGLHHPLHFSIRKTPLEKDKAKFAWKILSRMQPGWKISVSPADCAANSLPGKNEAASWLISDAGRPGPVNEILQNYKIDIYQYARLTRSEPAQLLGIDDIGHLKTGARANVSIYDFQPGSDPAKIRDALSHCWLLVKDGTVIIRNGNFTGDIPPAGPVISNIDIEVESLIKSDLLQRSTLRWENLAVNPR